jgi:hypothetical protein
MGSISRRSPPWHDHAARKLPLAALYSRARRCRRHGRLAVPGFPEHQHRALVRAAPLRALRRVEATSISEGVRACASAERGVEQRRGAASAPSCRFRRAESRMLVA